MTGSLLRLVGWLTVMFAIVDALLDLVVIAFGGVAADPHKGQMPMHSVVFLVGLIAIAVDDIRQKLS